MVTTGESAFCDIICSQPRDQYLDVPKQTQRKNLRNKKRKYYRRHRAALMMMEGRYFMQAI